MTWKASPLNEGLDPLFNGCTWGINVGDKYAFLNHSPKHAGYWFLTIHSINDRTESRMELPAERFFIEEMMKVEHLPQDISCWHMAPAKLVSVEFEPEPIPTNQEVSQQNGVYIIQAGDFVKIGSSNDIAKRIETFRCGNPHEINLLATIPGANLQDEFALHDKFSALRTRGEWFKYEQPLTGFIKGLQEGAKCTN